MSHSVSDAAAGDSIENQGVVLGTWGAEFTLRLLPSGVAVLTLEVPGRANTLSTEIIGHFSQALDAVQKDARIKALIFRSGKKDHFAYGADVKEIAQFGSEEVARRSSANGHKVYQQVLDITKPTLVAVHGPCLGGGLELALCFDKRICSNAKETVFAMPEVTLGVIPGLGGTQRLPRLIGVKPALEMILFGHSLSVEQALKANLVDESVEVSGLMQRAESLALALCSTQTPEDKLQVRYTNCFEPGTMSAEERTKIDGTIKTLERILKMRVTHHYPAPLLALETVKFGVEHGLAAGIEKETGHFGELASSDVARNLIALAFHKEIARQSANRTLSQVGGIASMGVVGAGTMGKGIAESSLKAGIAVRVKTSGTEKARAEADRLNTKGYKAVAQAAASDADLSECELVIESVYENLDTKKQVLQGLSRALSHKPGAVLATNTSSIPLSQLSQFVENKANFLGLHFFNPVDKMPLVEVIPQSQTSPDVQKRALAFLAQTGKVPILVKDSPGFLVNRLLACLLLDALRIADEGVPVDWIETAARDFGLPLPPFEMFDELSWEIAMSVAYYMRESFGERFAVPPLVPKALALGLQGKKTGAGCYTWTGNKRGALNPVFLATANVKTSSEPLDETNRSMILNRIFLPMIDEAARCLEEHVVRKPRDIDLAVIIGLGFPPYTGGLLKYADSLGIDSIVDSLTAIYEAHDPPGRTISGMLAGMKNTARGFYGAARE